MNIINTHIKDCIIIEPKVYGDSRGFFLEVYHEKRYQQAGIIESFVQDNRSRSSQNVLRGLHFQKNNPQGKLVSVTAGEVYDVAVDLRANSETFGQYVGVYLSSTLNNQMYIPPGFAHGFLVLSGYADFYYKCTEFYDPADECGILWNDPDIDINWPLTGNPILSDKDIKLPNFLEIEKMLRSGERNG